MTEPRVGLFGGTFNPPHVGHLVSACRFYDACALSYLVVMPDYLPPHKQIDHAPSADHRFAMTKLAFQDEMFCGKNITVSDYELSRKGKSYTIDTVRHLLTAFRVNKLFVYVGSDMFLSLESWKDAQALFELCIFAASPREPGEPCLAAMRQAKAHYEECYGANVILLDGQPVDASSTGIRTAFEHCNDLPLTAIGQKKLLTDQVKRYIIENNLYLGESDPMASYHWEEPATPDPVIASIRSALLQDTKSERLSHILSVEKEALEYAKLLFPTYRIPEEYYRDVIACALLHDITKEKGLDEQLALCRKFGIAYTETDLASPAVFHAKTGAYLAKAMFGINARVFGSIYRHTLGGQDMNLFEKIIFLADYTEPLRSYQDCKDARKRFWEGYAELADGMRRKDVHCPSGQDGPQSKHERLSPIPPEHKGALDDFLDGILVTVFDGTIRHLLTSRRVIHPDTVNARNSLLLKQYGHSSDGT